VLNREALKVLRKRYSAVRKYRFSVIEGLFKRHPGC
jgi:hypothetical protein